MMVTNGEAERSGVTGKEPLVPLEDALEFLTEEQREAARKYIRLSEQIRSPESDHARYMEFNNNFNKLVREFNASQEEKTAEERVNVRNTVLAQLFTSGKIELNKWLSLPFDTPSGDMASFLDSWMNEDDQDNPSGETHEDNNP